MKITQDVRDYAATLNDPATVGLSIAGTLADGLSPRPEEARSAVSKDEAERGMAQMSEKFKAMGEQLYLDADKVKESNRVL
jgi:phosphomethylpyrimidine synthase